MLIIGHALSTAMTTKPPPTRALLCALLTMLGATPAMAQAPGSRIEQVSYWNVQDSMFLTASLTLPSEGGPHPGVVVLSMAGTERLVQRLVGDGYAVLMPVPRGFVAVEPLLQATFSDLAGDVLAALAYLGSRAEVDQEALGLIAQADNSPPAMLAALEPEAMVPIVLLAPPAFSGVETFRREQLWLAERSGFGAADLQALEKYVAGIGEIVLDGRTPYMREFRLESLRAGSGVQLPRNNAAFPADERQMHFFASPLWHDRLAFEPEEALARLWSPVLVLIGADDPNTPMDAYLQAVRRGFSGASTPDATVCLIPGRTRHLFTEQGVAAISEWLAGRMGGPSASRPRPVPGCLEDTGR